MAVQIQSRRGTSADWAAADPVLALGEIGYDSTENKLKVGDGTKKWSALSWLKGDGGAAGTGTVDLSEYLKKDEYDFKGNVLIGTGDVATGSTGGVGHAGLMEGVDRWKAGAVLRVHQGIPGTAFTPDKFGPVWGNPYWAKNVADGGTLNALELIHGTSIVCEGNATIDIPKFVPAPDVTEPRSMSGPPFGWEIKVTTLSPTGTVTFVPSGGAVVHSDGGKLKHQGQYKWSTLTYSQHAGGSDAYILAGSLVA